MFTPPGYSSGSVSIVWATISVISSYLRVALRLTDHSDSTDLRGAIVNAADQADPAIEIVRRQRGSDNSEMVCDRLSMVCTACLPLRI